MVLVSNYSGGSLAVWPLDKDGAPVGEAQVIQHTGKGRNPVRQEGPHVHSITFTRDEKYAVAVDLDLDELVIYPVDKEEGRLKEEEKTIFVRARRKVQGLRFLIRQEIAAMLPASSAARYWFYLMKWQLYASPDSLHSEKCLVSGEYGSGYPFFRR